MTATVIDADAQRIAMLRGDTAGVHTFEASWGKAYTAVGFAPLLKLGDEVNGAIGVGGAPSAEADEACARAGLDKVRDRIR